MKTNLKWTSLIAVALVVMVLFSSTAFAQEPEREPAKPPAQQIVWLALLAETLDMSVEELKAELKAGKTVEELATEQGLTLADVATDLYERAVERLDAAVAEGKLTQDKADEMEARLVKRRDACVDDGQCKLFPARKPVKQKVAQQLLQSLHVIAKNVDMNIFEVLRAFEAGSSLEEIALEQGSSLNGIADALYDAGAEKVEAALADGKFTQEQADNILARLADHRDDCANEGQCLLLPRQNKVTPIVKTTRPQL